MIDPITTVDRIVLTELETEWEKISQGMLSPVNVIQRMIVAARNNTWGTNRGTQQRNLLVFIADKFKKEDEEKYQAFKNELDLLRDPASVFRRLTEDPDEGIEVSTEIARLGKKYGPFFKDWNKLWQMSLEELDEVFKEKSCLNCKKTGTMYQVQGEIKVHNEDNEYIGIVYSCSECKRSFVL